MKDKVVDANFPRTDEGRVYHLGIRAGEVANRIICVGSPSRAQVLASNLDATPAPFTLTSERGFLTITGRYKDVPVSICSIGMGSANADFFVREVRESLTGDMIVIRLGSCGALAAVPVGSVVLPAASVSVTRNYDFDFRNWTETPDEEPYRISRAVPADPELLALLASALAAHKPADWAPPIVSDVVNASADSFYSSQGRQTSFPDHNTDLIDELQEAVPGLATLEMETFHILHLAASWPLHAPRTLASALPGSASPSARTPNDPPVTAAPVSPAVSGRPSEPPASDAPQPSGSPAPPLATPPESAAPLTVATELPVPEAVLSPSSPAPGDGPVSLEEAFGPGSGVSKSAPHKIPSPLLLSPDKTSGFAPPQTLAGTLGIPPSPRGWTVPLTPPNDDDPDDLDEASDELGTLVEIPAARAEPTSFPLTARTSKFALTPLQLAGNTRVRAAAAHMVFAQRSSRAFVTPEDVARLEVWAARGVLDAIVQCQVDAARLHPEAGSVWANGETPAESGEGAVATEENA